MVGEKHERRRDAKKSRGKYASESSTSSGEGDEERDGRHYRREKKLRTKNNSKRRSRRRHGDEVSPSSVEAESEGFYSSSDSSSDGRSSSTEESEGERRHKERRKRRDKERQKHKYKEEKMRRKERRRKEERKREKKDKYKDHTPSSKKRKAMGKTGAVTNSWGKYGVIREIDMWNKRPEFMAWLLEIKQANHETLSNWEEKKMFKEYMEDYNTATFPSKKYYDIDAYHKNKMEKQIKKGVRKLKPTEMTIFNDEERRRMEVLRDREKQKEEQVEELKRSMQGGMAQAMKEQARLREEMAYQYKLGNFEAAAAIQKRLDPDSLL